MDMLLEKKSDQMLFLFLFFRFSKLLLLANLLENLLTSLSRETSTTSADVAFAVQASASRTTALDPKQTKPLSSSSGQDQVESESLPSETVSSAVFSQIQQVRNLNSVGMNASTSSGLG